LSGQTANHGSDVVLFGLCLCACVHSFCTKVKPDYEASSGKTYSTFKGVSYTQQVVAGMNYKVKVSYVRVYVGSYRCTYSMCNYSRRIGNFIRTCVCI